jgi:hypothetical protein
MVKYPCMPLDFFFNPEIRMKPKLRNLLAVFMFFPLSVFAGAISQALSDSLSGRGDTTLVPIAIYLKQPQFQYPMKGTVSDDSLRKYSLMVIDSTKRYLISLTPATDSLFLKNDLRSVFFTGHRMKTSETGRDYTLYCLAAKPAIEQLSLEPIIGLIDLQPPVAFVPNALLNDSAIFQSAFPFDTVISGFKTLVGTLVWFKPTTFFINRYRLMFHLYEGPEPTIQPQPVCADFIGNGIGVINFPGAFCGLLHGMRYPVSPDTMSYVKIDTGFYKTHEYRFPLGGRTIFMKVTDANTLDWMNVRFDTASMLASMSIDRPKSVPTSAVSAGYALLNENGRLSFIRSTCTGECRITMYDIRGRYLSGALLGPAVGKAALPRPAAAGVFLLRIAAGNRTFSRTVVVTK